MRRSRRVDPDGDRRGVSRISSVSPSVLNERAVKEYREREQLELNERAKRQNAERKRLHAEREAMREALERHNAKVAEHNAELQRQRVANRPPDFGTGGGTLPGARDND
jgi:hypothetical protein